LTAGRRTKNKVEPAQRWAVRTLVGLDPVAALIMVPMIAKEGFEGVQGKPLRFS